MDNWIDPGLSVPELTAAQAAYVESPQADVVFVADRGRGKTYALYAAISYIAVPGTRGLLIDKARGSHYGHTPPWVDDWLIRGIEYRQSLFRYSFGADTHLFRGEAYAGDDLYRFNGLKFDYIAIDNADQMTMEEYDIYTRLLLTGSEYSKLLLTCCDLQGWLFDHFTEHSNIRRRYYLGHEHHNPNL